MYIKILLTIITVTELIILIRSFTVVFMFYKFYSEIFPKINKMFSVMGFSEVQEKDKVN